MEIKINIPDPKVPEYPKPIDYSPQITALEKAVLANQSRIFEQEMKVIKQLFSSTQNKDLSALEKRLAAIERIFGQIPKMFSERTQPVAYENGLKQAVLNSTKEIVSALRAQNKSSEPVLNALKEVEKKLKRFSLPTVVVKETGPKLTPYVT